MQRDRSPWKIICGGESISFGCTCKLFQLFQDRNHVLNKVCTTQSKRSLIKGMTIAWHHLRCVILWLLSFFVVSYVQSSIPSGKALELRLSRKLNSLPTHVNLNFVMCCSISASSYSWILLLKTLRLLNTLRRDLTTVLLHSSRSLKLKIALSLALKALRLNNYLHHNFCANVFQLNSSMNLPSRKR